MTATSLVAYAVPNLTGAADSLDAVSCRSRQTGDAAFVVSNSTLYRYDAASVGPANGTTIIKAADGAVGTGFWLASVTIDPAALGSADRNIAYGNAGALDFMAGWRSSSDEFALEATTNAAGADGWAQVFRRNYISISGERWVLGGSFDPAVDAKRIDFWSWYADFAHNFYLSDSPSEFNTAAFYMAASAADNPDRKSGTFFSDVTTRFSFFSGDAFLSDHEGVIRITASQRGPSNQIDMRDDEVFLWSRPVDSGDELAVLSFSTTLNGTGGVFLNRVI